MNSFGKLWAGKLYSTNTGNLFLELNSSDGNLTGILRLSDDRFGLALYAVTGVFDGTSLELSGTPSQTPEGVDTGTISAKATLTPEGQLRGKWSSTIGAGGTFVLLPHDAALQRDSPSSLLPERIHTATRVVGAIRLYADDVQELIVFLGKDFAQGRVIVTYRERGNEISRYASDLIKDDVKPGELRYF